MQLIDTASHRDSNREPDGHSPVPSRRSFGGLSIDPSTQAAYLGAAPLGLSRIETSVLWALLERKDLPLSREAIATALNARAQRTAAPMIDVCVLRLRQKLAAAGWPGCILTVPGRGYLAIQVAKDFDPEPPTAANQPPPSQRLLCAC